MLLHKAGRNDEAEQWWDTAAAEGSVDAMFNLGNFCMKHQRVQEAEDWLTRAARAGHLQDDRLDGTRFPARAGHVLFR